MTPRQNLKNQSSHLILARTHRDRIRDNLTVIMKGEGVRVFDQDGKCYLDLEAGMTRPVHVGYGRKEIAQAAHDQMVELCYFTPMEFANLPALRLAEVLSEIAPGEINQFFFVSSGSEAVESALNWPNIITFSGEIKNATRSFPDGELTTGLQAGR